MGRLVPAGTGLDRYQGLGIQVEAPEDELTVDGLEISEGAFNEGGLGEASAEESAIQFDPGALDV